MKLKFLLIGGNGLLGYSVANFLIKKNLMLLLFLGQIKKFYQKKSNG